MNETNIYKHTLERYFREYYGPLCRFSNYYVRNETLAEDIVQEVFCDILRRVPVVLRSGSVKTYLQSAVYNQCMKALNREADSLITDMDLYDMDLPDGEADGISDESGVRMREIESTVVDLPDKCREIFVLSKYEGLENREIADYKHISVKTVENQMTKAIKFIRERLKANH
ncbi:DNA-directed RNA polymerase sigma-70 factor (plasmid) [Fulvitalea axinellae]|uniref:DNA-directed RNA polymerase sigma-70 factor n=1 Tax=Fulvitalea axinellae TaxID=1182444 RepID=A0AAU9CIN3_9BACT|nr:DNA-directed RNA polymerase sigma-70 factor [Fulvitalea axinellae]